MFQEKWKSQDASTLKIVLFRAPSMAASKLIISPKKCNNTKQIQAETNIFQNQWNWIFYRDVENAGRYQREERCLVALETMPFNKVFTCNKGKTQKTVLFGTKSQTFESTHPIDLGLPKSKISWRFSTKKWSNMQICCTGTVLTLLHWVSENGIVLVPWIGSCTSKCKELLLKQEKH